MADNVNNADAGTAMQAYTLVDDGWNSPIDDEGAGRQIQGTLLRFDDKQWFAGKEKAAIPNGSCYIALSIRTGWKRWENGKVVDFVTEIDGHYPNRHELGYTDESKWECGPDDKPTDPLQNSREVLLIDPHTCTAYTFCTASAGGRSAVDDLKNAVRNARRLRPGVVPLLSLEWQVMRTKYGMRSKPYFKIVDWSIPGAEVIAIAHDSGGMNDPIR
ncbi:hypothetical protein ACT4MK_32070 [Bradyrhizobium barranii]|uniref:hypothetical protein n=1 Tax=Bradyrhizobium TaxID=374 RepID=UPI0007C1AAEB|nr:hypothetical protein [Bradyrhizobium sp.]CUU15689.1 hypothetical protein CDS [Bradyrhizobium sp.]